MEKCKCEERINCAYESRTTLKSKTTKRDIVVEEGIIRSSTMFCYNQIKIINKIKINDRIVPSCFREKCGHHNARRRERGRVIRHRDSYNRIKSYTCNKKNSKVTLLSVVNEKPLFDDISTGSLTSCDELDTLMASTRERMKRLEGNINVIPKICESRQEQNNSINSSIHSLETLVLDNALEDFTEDMNDISNTAYSPTMNPEDLLEGDTENNNVYFKTEETNWSILKTNHTFIKTEELN